MSGARIIILFSLSLFTITSCTIFGINKENVFSALGLSSAAGRGVACCSDECIHFSLMGMTYEIDDACMCRCISSRGVDVPDKPGKCKYQFLGE